LRILQLGGLDCLAHTSVTGASLRGSNKKPANRKRINMLKTLDVEELSVILRKAPSTIKVDLRRRPERIPPPIRIPGSGKLLWIESDVEYWFKKYRQKPKQGK